MRILVVTHNYPRFVGDPAGAFVARIAEAASRAGNLVQVVAPHAPGLAQEETTGGVRLQRFHYAPERFEQVAYTGDLHRRALFSPAAAAAFPAFLLGFRRAIGSAIREFAPDVVHAHWWLPAGWLVAKFDTPFIVTCHGSDVRLLEKWAGFRRLARPVLTRAGAVTTVSRFLANDLQRLIGEPAAKVLPLAMPVDAEHFARGKVVSKVDPPRILYAGNLVPSKGVDTLLKAYALLRERGIRCGLRILGEGPQREALEKLAVSLGCADVEWSDFLPQTSMPQEYGGSTVTVLPTRGDAEGLGLTLVEALFAGAAVVGTRAGGIPEVIRDEETGLLAGADVESLAAALQRMLSEPELRRRLTEEGSRHVAAVFSPDRAIGPFLSLYQDVAQHSSRN